MNQTILFEQLASELSFIRANYIDCEWNKTLHYCQTTLNNSDLYYHPTGEDMFLYDVLLKTILRGKRPFCSYFTEKVIVNNYGNPFSLKELEQNKQGSIKYTFDETLKDTYRTFDDLIEPWHGDIDGVDFDPNHPENEKALFARLVERFGAKIAHCIETQANIANIIERNAARSYTGQRADFLISLPNGRALLLEPGNHDESRQIALDEKRDKEFLKVGISTHRMENQYINESHLYDQIEKDLTDCDAFKYLSVDKKPRSELQLAANYLFLLPSLITRVERLLLHFWFKEGLAHSSGISIGIIERDLECAEIALASFIDRHYRLCTLYGISCKMPAIELHVKRNANYKYKRIQIPNISVKECKNFDGVDLLLDVGIKCNNLTKPELTGAKYSGAVRQTYKHNEPIRFGYLSSIRKISENGKEIDVILNSFIQDFFRKKNMREGQKEIITNVLSQKSTIGLLPTSAGKSLCYQLSSLLTPGITFVVDPIVALMNDQVQGLAEQFGIDRVFPWHAGSKVKDDEVGKTLTSNIIVIISPERLQRPGFRKALRLVNATDVYVNYAVIDEAHCVSMWGHDFRPSYLMLERNFEKYFSFQGRNPVLIALTGTASQLVLIDLKRELNIQEIDAIVRPKTFNRDELNFNLVRCSADEKNGTLKHVMNSIARRLNVQSLETDACGIIFAYTPKELFELLGEHVADSYNYIRTLLNQKDTQGLHYGIYTGKPPKGIDLNTDEWNTVKDLTLKAFKRGDIRMLFGNTAISVGIDNEQLNYIINYKMPQSLEAYYQQCGRAGRAGQNSECVLIFSDDSPADTQRWLDNETPVMKERFDDLGIVSYFHRSNFPGKNEDTIAAFKVFKHIMKEKPDQKGMVAVPKYFESKPQDFAERTERYISYWLILGVLSDYEVTGIGDRTTVYHVHIHDNIKKFLEHKDEKKLEEHLASCLYNYMSRYRPLQVSDLEKQINKRKENNLSERYIGYLIDFIYDQIEYQRREAIRTMVSFCNQEDPTPEKLRNVIKAYFDSSEKFSEDLLSMAETLPLFSNVEKILSRIDGFDDAEHLFWETRRLLDERYRADWAIANLYSIIYRARGVASEEVKRQFNEMVSSLSEIHDMDFETVLRFLADFLSYLIKLDEVIGELLSLEIQRMFTENCYLNYGLAYMKIIDKLLIPVDNRAILKLHITNLQLKELIDERYSRVAG